MQSDKIARVWRHKPQASYSRTGIAPYVIGAIFMVAWINGLLVLFG